MKAQQCFGGAEIRAVIPIFPEFQPTAILHVCVVHRVQGNAEPVRLGLHPLVHSSRGGSVQVWDSQAGPFRKVLHAVAEMRGIGVFLLRGGHAPPWGVETPAL